MRVQVNPEELRSPEVPDGVYPAVVEKCNPQDSEGNDVSDGQTPDQLFWQFEINGADDPQWNGRRVFARTKLQPGQGDFYLRYVTGLGYDPSDFDTEAVVGTSCFIRTKQNIRKSKDGDQRTYVNVAEVSKG